MKEQFSAPVTPEEYKRWRNERFEKLDNNVRASIESLRKLDKYHRFTFDVQEFICFLEGLLK